MSDTPPTDETGPDPASEVADQPVGDTEVEAEVAATDVVEEPLDELTEAKIQAEEYLATAQRLQADFANFRKRADAERADAGDKAVEKLVEKLLPVLDTIDLARSHGQADALEQLAGPLTEILGSAGLVRVDPKGEAFDPTLHDAVMHDEGDGSHDGPTVVEVFRAGFTWKGRVLRAAMVKVAG